MAFGRIAKARKKRKKQKLRNEQKLQEQQEKITQAQDPTKIGESYQQIQDVATGIDQAGTGRREEGRQQNIDQTMEEVNTPQKGLDESTRAALQESGNAQINSQIKNMQRNIASMQGGSGIRGGAAAAPQVALADKGLEAQGQLQRDLIAKDSDIAMKRLAAFLSGLQGKSADDILRNQGIFDYITSEQEKRKQGVYTDKYDKDYIGV